jgi:Zn-dependent protease with chaperone function
MAMMACSRKFLVPGFWLLVGVKLKTGNYKLAAIFAALLLCAMSLSACVAVSSAPPRRTTRAEYSPPPASYSRRDDTVDGERLRRVMPPLLQAMDHPCRMDQVRVGIINQSEINAANAGNCEFFVTMGLLRRANDDQLRGVLAHEIAHQDLGHVAKAQVLGAGINILSAGLQQLFPAAGALAPIAGELFARGYGRSEEYAADQHGVDILRRAGYGKDTMLDALTWIRRVSGDSGGGFLSTHPALDDRIVAVERMR